MVTHLEKHHQIIIQTESQDDPSGLHDQTQETLHDKSSSHDGVKMSLQNKNTESPDTCRSAGNTTILSEMLDTELEQVSLIGKPDSGTGTLCRDTEEVSPQMFNNELESPIKITTKQMKASSPLSISFF